MSNMNWYHGDFMTGEFKYSGPMPVIKGASGVDYSVDNEDTGDLSISLKGMPVEVQNNWNEFYKEMLDFVALVNDDTKEVIFAGFINKVTPNLKEQSLKFQLKTPAEYMKARIIGEKLGEFTDATNDTRDFSGSTWSHVISHLVQRCFDSSSITNPNAPVPPSIMGGFNPHPDYSPELSQKKKSVILTDALTYREVIDEVASDDSGLGLEYRFIPRFTDEAYNKVAWDLVVGNSSSPFINEKNNLNIILKNHEDWQKISEFSQQIDASRKYTSFYAQSKQGDEKTNTGADFSNVFIPKSEYPLLLEKFYSPGVELNRLELDRQMDSYISYGLEDTRTGSITLELNSSRFKLWSNVNLGVMVNFTAPSNSLAAGNSCKMRIIGVRLNPDNGQVVLDLASKSQRYPKLPRNRVKDMTENKKKNSKSPRNKNAKMKDSKLNSGNITTPGTYPPNVGGIGQGTETGAGIGGIHGAGGEIDITANGDFKPGQVYNLNKTLVNDAQTIGNVGWRWGDDTDPVLYDTEPPGRVTNRRPFPSGTWELSWYIGEDPSATDERTVASSDQVMSQNYPDYYWSIGQSSFFLQNGTIVNFAERNQVDITPILNRIITSLDLFKLRPTAGSRYNTLSELQVVSQQPIIIRNKMYTPMMVIASWRGDYNTVFDSEYVGSILFMTQEIVDWNRITPPNLTLAFIPFTTDWGANMGTHSLAEMSAITNRIGDWIFIAGTRYSNNIMSANFGLTDANIQESQWVGFAPNPNDLPSSEEGRTSYRIFSMCPIRYWINGAEQWYLSTTWAPSSQVTEELMWWQQAFETRGMKIMSDGTPIPLTEGQPWEFVTPEGRGAVINFGRFPILLEPKSSGAGEGSFGLAKCWSQSAGQWRTISENFFFPYSDGFRIYVGAGAFIYRPMSYGKWLYFGDKALTMEAEII